MRSRDYTQEIGVSTSARQRVPAAVGFVVLAVVAVAAIYFISQVLAYQPPAHHAEAAQPVAVKVSQR